jgi:hypothetical protein
MMKRQGPRSYESKRGGGIFVFVNGSLLKRDKLEY